MKYERSITSGLEVMAKVKVFVHATDADADADGRAMTLAPRAYMCRLAKKCTSILKYIHIEMVCSTHVAGCKVAFFHKNRNYSSLCFITQSYLLTSIKRIYSDSPKSKIKQCSKNKVCMSQNEQHGYLEFCL